MNKLEINRLTKRILPILMLFSLIANGEQKEKLSFSTTEIVPGLYMLEGVGGFTGGNIALSIGKDGVVMIDDSMPPMLDIMSKAIKTITQQPVDFLINTHIHGDHTGNNESLGNTGAKIVAHDNLRKRLIKEGIQTADGKKPTPAAALPVITFSHDISFHLNDNNAHVFHVPHAHTDGDAVIHFVDLNVIHTGDVFFNGMFPYIDLAGGGSVKGYIKAQQDILALANEKTRIIPGHGALASRNELKATLDMLLDAEKIISQLIKQGKSEEDVVALNPLKKYHDKWNWAFISTEKMTRQMYQGLSK